MYPLHWVLLIIKREKLVSHGIVKQELAQLRSKNAQTGQLVKQLRLFLGKDGLLQVGGRLHNAPIDDSAKFPILIPSRHKLSELIIHDAHVRVLHSGLQSTITCIRERFWITCIRQRVKSLLRGCVVCKRVMGKPYRSPIPAPLQASRITLTRPFSVCGVDFTGCLYVKAPRSENKVYVCLFTCAVTRAIHLELVKDLSVHSFLLAFRRFAGRRSLPEKMISDNATTFLAAASDIKQLLESPTVKSYMVNHRVDWLFIPKRAPWFGGFYERLIGLTKNALKKVLGRRFLTFDELHTVLVEIEAMLNDRPLTYVSDEVSDPQPLTPSHFLYGRKLTSLPHDIFDTDELSDPTFGSSSSDLQRRAVLMAEVQNQFCRRWSSEYLNSLRDRDRNIGKGLTENQIKKGDIVLVHEDNTPRVKWSLARVEELVYGNDGLVRSASIRTSRGITNRPIVKLYHLESTD